MRVEGLGFQGSKSRVLYTQSKVEIFEFAVVSGLELEVYLRRARVGVKAVV